MVFVVFVWAWFAACTASYMGVVADRGWRGSMRGRSLCVCGRQLGWSENIPVVSYIRLRGRALCCGSRLPVRYLVSEAVFPLAVVASYAAASHIAAFVTLVLSCGVLLILKESSDIS